MLVRTLKTLPQSIMNVWENENNETNMSSVRLDENLRDAEDSGALLLPKLAQGSPQQCLFLYTAYRLFSTRGTLSCSFLHLDSLPDSVASALLPSGHLSKGFFDVKRFPASHVPPAADPEALQTQQCPRGPVSSVLCAAIHPP